MPQPVYRLPRLRAEAFSAEDLFSIADLLALRGVTSSALLALRGSSRVDHGPSTPHAAALLVLADRALQVGVLASVSGPALAVRGRVDSVAQDPVAPVQCRLRVRLRVPSVLLDVRAAATSSIRRPRKAR